MIDLTAFPLTETTRIVIGGGPDVGKTTLAKQIAALTGLPVTHTDDLLAENLEWSEMSQRIADLMAAPGPWIIEGTPTARALRKALEASDAAPCDILIWLTRPWVEFQARGQVSMAKGCQTVMNDIELRLSARGVSIVTDPRFSS